MPDLYSDVYGSGYSNPNSQPEWMDNSLINNFATRGLLSGVQWLGETLGKPQRALFGAVGGLLDGDIGKSAEALKNLIPLSDTFGWTDPSKSVSGRDLLRKAGLADSEDTWGNYGAGLALDIAADPVAWLRGPMGALTKAGEAAQKGTGFERSLIGRMKTGQGGLFSITNKPWYAEMLPGAKKAENIYVAGARDAADLSKATSPFYEGIATGMNKGWRDATRWTIPGTEFSPLAKLRSALEPGAANVTGHAVLTDTLGESVVPAIRENDALAGQLSLAQFEARSRASSFLQRKGFAANTADQWIEDAARSTQEIGEAILPREPISPQVANYLKGVGKIIAKRERDITDPILAQTNRLGGGIDPAGGMWRPRYSPRSQAGMGINPTQQEMQRSALIAKSPEQSVQFDRWASDPRLAGFARAKAAGQPFDEAAVKAQRQAVEDYLTQDIKSSAQRRLERDPSLINEETSHMATEGGARSHASDVADYLMYTDPEIQARGRYYNADRATADRNYAFQEGRKNALRHGLLETFRSEARPMSDMLTKVSDTADVVPLTKALDEVGLKGTKAIPNAVKEELARRMNIPVGDLDKHGLDAGLVKAMKLELQGPKAEKSTMWSRMVDNFRYLVTVPFPANLTRNVADSQLTQFLSGEPVTGLGNAIKGIKGALDPKSAYAADFARHYPAAIAYGVAGNSEQTQLIGKGITRSGDIAVNVLPEQSAKSIAQLAREGTAPVYSEEARKAMGIASLRDSEMLGGKAAEAARPPTAKEWIDANTAPAVAQPQKLPGKPLATREDLLADMERQYGSKAESAAARESAPTTVAKTVQPVLPASTASAKPPTTAADWIRDKVAKVFDPVKGYAGMMEAGQRITDDAARVQQFINLKKAGFSDKAAAERVATVQRKYEDTTPFIRKMRNYVPFINFSYQNMKTQADLLSRQPGRYNALMTLMNSGRSSGGFVPGYASSGSAIPIGGKDAEGKQTFLGSMGTSQEDEMLSSLASFLALRPTEGVRKLASSSNPALKALYELATSKQVFSGRNLDDLKPGVIPGILTGGNETAARFLSQAASGTPAARFMSTVDRVADAPNRGYGSTALNLLTGMRTVNVDQEAARQIAARDTLTQMLNASSQYKLRENLVVEPQWKGREDEIPEPLKEMWALYQQLQRQGKIVAKQKAEAAR